MSYANRNFPTGDCDRCHKHTGVTIMSCFNRDEICMECQDLEQKHPEYERAKQVEHEQVVAGNMNFTGIGLPLGYEEWARQVVGEVFHFIKTPEDTGEGFDTKNEPWRNRRKRDRR